MIIDQQQLKNFLRVRGFKPKDYLGQNFLIDKDVLEQIVRIADIKPTDTVLEVGPGLGALTYELIAKAKEVWAIEKDPKLVALLKTEFKGVAANKLKIINENILRFHISRNILTPYKVVANIPYYLTSKLLQYFLEQDNVPKQMVLMIQKEVGERVTATAGDLSILGISVQVYADVEIAGKNKDETDDDIMQRKIPWIIPKTSFWPVPDVDSVILKITPRDKYPMIKDKKLFFKLIKIAFAGKRKQIQNSLRHGLQLPKEAVEDLLSESKILPTTRPQDLRIEQWVGLYQTAKTRNVE